MKGTIVIPCHNEERNVRALHAALVDVVGASRDFEFLFVDDGSTDGTLAEIRALRSSDPRVGYISFLTNYGHQKALFAGLRHSHLDFAISMDGDLQHPPRYIPAFLAERDRTGADIVVARRSSGQGGFFKNLFSNAFPALFSRATGVAIPAGVSDFRFYSRRALDLLASINERDPFLRGMLPVLRLKTAMIDYEMPPRHDGRPSYTFGKSLRMGVRALLRFSDLPVRIGFALAGFGILLSAAEIAQYLYLRLFTDALVPGQAELIVFLAFISSVILLLLALLCRMALQILDYLRGQPTYIIADKALAPSGEPQSPDPPRETKR